ncbi:hypothetical protein HK101_007207 [Irineochytrium annulatum]|nr:hypothetical protein HK101_007207 [Irineochytrium annulatum]
MVFNVSVSYNQNQWIPLSNGTVDLGRGGVLKDIKDPQVSRKQVECTVDSIARSVTVARCGLNPTYLNEKEIKKDRVVNVKHGDVLRLIKDKHPVRFRIEDRPEQTQATQAQTMDIDTQCQDAQSLPSQPRSLGRGKRSSAAHASLPKKADERTAAAPDDPDEGAGALVRIQEHRETDDEGDDLDDRRWRRDFSDESEDIAFSDEEGDVDSLAGDVKDRDGLTVNRGDSEEPAQRPKPKPKPKLKPKPAPVVKAEAAVDDKGELLPEEVVKPKPRLRANEPAVKKDVAEYAVGSRLGALERWKKEKEGKKRTRKGKEKADIDKVSAEPGTEGNAVVKKEGSKIKKVTPYGVFSKEMRKRVAEENSNLSAKQVTELLRHQFKELTASESAKYREFADAQNEAAAVEAEANDSDVTADFNDSKSPLPRRKPRKPATGAAANDSDSATDREANTTKRAASLESSSSDDLIVHKRARRDRVDQTSPTLSPQASPPPPPVQNSLPAEESLLFSLDSAEEHPPAILKHKVSSILFSLDDGEEAASSPPAPAATKKADSSLLFSLDDSQADDLLPASTPARAPASSRSARAGKGNSGTTSSVVAGESASASASYESFRPTGSHRRPKEKVAMPWDDEFDFENLGAEAKKREEAKKVDEPVRMEVDAQVSRTVLKGPSKSIALKAAYKGLLVNSASEDED